MVVVLFGGEGKEDRTFQCFVSQRSSYVGVFSSVSLIGSTANPLE